MDATVPDFVLHRSLGNHAPLALGFNFTNFTNFMNFTN